jgi:ammonium transporter Rh
LIYILKELIYQYTSYGTWFGRIETPYLIVAVTIETLFYSLNHFIGFNKLEVVNPGMSIFVHVFGAFFGAAVSLVAGWDRKRRGSAEEHTSYHSQKLSFLGNQFNRVFSS